METEGPAGSPPVDAQTVHLAERNQHGNVP